MIVQAICLLDDIDKELNNYVMRAREWYGWHFPELGKILTDNQAYIRTVMAMGEKSKRLFYWSWFWLLSLPYLEFDLSN